MKKSLIQRFEEKFLPEPNTGCWLWTGATTKRGYGSFWVKDKHVGSHRVSYELYIGPIPEGLCICHKCDTPACVNPDHFFLGTHSENMCDMAKKGRSPTLFGLEKRPGRSSDAWIKHWRKNKPKNLIRKKLG